MTTRIALSAGFITILAAQAAHAQSIAPEIKLGVNFSSLSVSETAGFDTNARAGVTVGLGVGIPASGIVAVQPELLYSVRRFDATTPAGSVPVTARAFEFPVFVTVRLGAGSPFRVGIGPHFAVIDHVSQRIESTDVDISDDVRDFDGGITAVAAYEIGGRKAFVIEGRASAGFRNLSEDASVSMKSRSVAIFGGYRF